MAKKSSYKNELINEIKTLSQSNGLNAVFTTFLEITATSIAAQMDPANAEEREKRYQEIASKMTPETLSSYARMFALLTLATREHAEDPCDILGDVYHELRLNNEWNGQFFTPDHICRLMAQLLEIDVPEDKDGPVTINEPACGSGTMVIGAVWAIRETTYELVFDGELDVKRLDDIFYIFNCQLPEGYRGRSMSVSDVVWAEGLGTFFCDSFGYKPIKFKQRKCPWRNFDG